MTKNKRWAFAVLIPFILSLVSIWMLSERPQNSLSNAKTALIKPTGKIDLKTISRMPASVPANAQIPVVSLTKTGLAHPVWKEKVENSLITQAGGTLKHAEIEKVDSFNWKIGKVDVKVDSIIVKLQHSKGHRSSFRAIVDASNGKILQTWDHPVLDDFNPKTRYGVKVDPRYHNN